MRHNQSLLTLGVTILSLILPNICLAGSEIDSRVTRLENIVANELNIKLLNQIDAMQQEISELRGKLEEQQNTMQNINQKQDKLYLNLDTRINKLNEPNQTSSVNNPATNPAAKPAQHPVGTNQSTATSLEEPIVDKSEQGLFEAASLLMQERKYSEAVIEFKDLLWQYPDGIYAADTHYWLGELYLLQWQQNRHDSNLVAQAKESFTTVINRYQGHAKENDALLKLGLIEVDLEQWASAKEILQKVIQKNPQTAAARIAENNLRRVEQKQ
jgi:tol-pal system protein YbgF